MNQEKISKTISYWLRHAPQEAGLTADEFGWVDLSELIDKLREQNNEIDIDFIEALNISTDKVRWEIDRSRNRIRATHGHSYPVIIDFLQKPPDHLYHGTSLKNIPAILEQGILPMGRQFVHLSSDVKTAYTVGKRHGNSLVIEVDAKELYEKGHPFYHTSDNVWLTETIPSGYLSFKPWEIVTDEEERMSVKNQLIKEYGNRNYFISGKGWEDIYLAWRRRDCDDCLFMDSSGTCYMIHLIWGRKPEYPAPDVYSSFTGWVKYGLWMDQHYWYEF
ncbi:MAG: RNA 2'-phosphotransferase [Clostridiales bacterium]|jgi:putative RNA 2'-phosphotransferase|nr:RNA 2'-phosphotransferase [Clostridiales bacterium]